MSIMLMLLSICLIVQVQSLKVLHSSSYLSTSNSNNKVRLSTICYAAVDSSNPESAGGFSLDSSIVKVKAFTASSLYSAIESVIVFGLVSAIDGGFSGDWSKFGLISADLEETIRDAVTNVGLFHIVCGIAAAGVAKNQQLPIAPSVFHTLLIGGLGLFRVIMQTEETALRFPTVYQAKQSLANLFAGKYDAVVVNTQIDDLIRNNACVMFSFRSCPYCIKAKDLLINQLGATVEVLELDQDKAIGYPIRAELGKRTGRTSVPSIWIDGQFIGGCDDGPSTLTVPTVAKVDTSKLTQEKKIDPPLDFFASLLQSFGSLTVQSKSAATAASVTKVEKLLVSVSTKSGKGGVMALYEEGILQTLLAEAKAI